MVRPYYWPTIAKPAGASTGEWMAGCLALKWTRWLSDPGPKPGDKLREKCLSVCTRPLFLHAHTELPVHPKSPFARKRGQPRVKLKSPERRKPSNE
jgi:hypothetical protein